MKMYTFILKTADKNYGLGQIEKGSPKLKAFVSYCLGFTSYESVYVYDHEYHEEHSLQELADTLGVDKNYIKEIK